MMLCGSILKERKERAEKKMMGITEEECFRFEIDQNKCEFILMEA